MSKITAEHITNIVGSPIANTRKYWPLILDELQRVKQNKLSFQVALLATVGVECGSFKPIDEMGGPKYFAKYDGREDLGNIHPGDGARYHGRGFIQLTGRNNYRRYGNLVGADLENNPELALNDQISIEILVLYCMQRNIHVWADKAFREPLHERTCLREIRRRVNGGYNGYKEFCDYWAKFKAVALSP